MKFQGILILNDVLIRNTTHTELLLSSATIQPSRVGWYFMERGLRVLGMRSLLVNVTPSFSV